MRILASTIFQQFKDLEALTNYVVISNDEFLAQKEKLLKTTEWSMIYCNKRVLNFVPLKIFRVFDILSYLFFCNLKEGLFNHYTGSLQNSGHAASFSFIHLFTWAKSSSNDIKSGLHGSKVSYNHSSSGVNSVNSCMGVVNCGIVYDRHESTNSWTQTINKSLSAWLLI